MSKLDGELAWWYADCRDGEASSGGLGRRLKGRRRDFTVTHLGISLWRDQDVRLDALVVYPYGKVVIPLGYRPTLVEVFLVNDLFVSFASALHTTAHLPWPHAMIWQIHKNHISRLRRPSAPLCLFIRTQAVHRNRTQMGLRYHSPILIFLCRSASPFSA